MDNSRMNGTRRLSLLATAILVCLGTSSCAITGSTEGVNARDEGGQTALMLAAYEGQADRVKGLIAEGADVNATDGHHETALLKAVFVARSETYEVQQPPSLAQQAGLVNFTPSLTMTRQLGSGAGNLDCVQALIAAGADLKAKDRDGMTALIESSVQNNISCAKALIAAGADVNATDGHGDTALKLATSPELTAILRAAGAK